MACNLHLPALEAFLAQHPNIKYFPPSSPNFDSLRQVWNASGAGTSLAVVQPQSALDVAALIKFVKAKSVPFTLRSGGHNLEGQALAAFNSLIMPTGTASILRCSLAMVRPWYPDIASVQFFEPIAIAPIFWDIVWCLMHREVPIIKPVLGRKGVVDRVAGLCTTLLPILYDLCVFSCQQNDGLAHDETLCEIENQIRAWKPDESGLARGNYSTFEILSMRTQATMYKAASLLLIHRLRYSLGTNNQFATDLANEILEARASFLGGAGPSAKLQHMAFPIFLALMEVESPVMSVWENSTCLRARPICMDGLVAFHEYVCDQRRIGFDGSLFDLVKSGPEFASFP
jgi:hypothetical protein